MKNLFLLLSVAILVMTIAAFVCSEEEPEISAWVAYGMTPTSTATPTPTTTPTSTPTPTPTPGWVDPLVVDNP
ncbi:MAG TPA: hypothetical protein PLB62_07645, partial [Candidatus Sumerlaeota bacterium]|nr:hypothetical protein [Candidatus Sumerlaeota bacterium]